MKIEIVHLKNYYPIIEQFGADPVLELMIQENFLKSLMRPVVLILTGGGYSMTARAEGQNVGVEFLTIGCNAQVVSFLMIQIIERHSGIAEKPQFKVCVP